MKGNCLAGVNLGLFLEEDYLEFHPIANVFPLMEGDEFRELVKDVQKNGQQQPILTYEGKILDGRNRYRACLEAGEEPWVESWSGDSPVGAVMSLNLHRRHLSSGQRSMIGVEVEKMLAAEARKRTGGRPKRDEKPTQKIEPVKNERSAASQAANLVGTNRQYISDAKKLRAEDPEAAEAVRRGEVSLPKAVEPYKKPKAPPEPTIGELFERGGVSLDDMPRRSEENKALYPIWQAILKVGEPMTERVGEGIPEAKQIGELKADAKTARDRLATLISELERKEKNRLRAVE